MKTVTLSACDALEAIQIAHFVGKTTSDQAALDAMDYLIDNIDVNRTTDIATIQYEDTEQRFALWLCMDLYKTFLEDLQPEFGDAEMNKTLRIMSLIGGPSDE